MQVLRKSYGRAVELGDDGWECACMVRCRRGQLITRSQFVTICKVCGREGQLLMCEHGMQPDDTVAHCPKVAHPKCAGLTDAVAVFICPMHPESCCPPAVREKLDAKSRALDESAAVSQSQVWRHAPRAS